MGGVTAWVGVSLLGLLLVLPASPNPSNDASAGALSRESPTDWSRPIVWTGQLATQVCAPNGIASCAGFRQGEHQDLHILALERSPSEVDIELRWEATTTNSEELVLWLDGVIEKRTCDDCSSYRFRVLGKTQGTSPLRISVTDLELVPGEELAILVRTPESLPRPVMAHAWAAQPFVVEGSMRGD